MMRSGAFTRIERSLYILKSRPSFPTRGAL